MPAQQLTGLARLPLFFLNRAESLGVSRTQLLRAARLRGSDLADPDGRVPLSTVRDVWRAFIARLPDPALGLKLGRTLKIRELGLVGYAMAHSSTLEDALRRLARYLRIINEAVHCRVENDREGTRVVVWGHRSLDVLRHPVDARLSLILAAVREITGADIVPLEVAFPYGRPAHLAAYRTAFGRAKLLFGRPHATIKLRARDLALPIRAPDPTLAGFLDQLAEQEARSLGRHGGRFAERAAAAIWSALSGGPLTLERTASALGVSSRTLQRRLREEGTTLARVLDDLRHELSGSLLHNRRLAIHEIAFMLGYSEPSTFYRAFRRWHGVSPGRYRATIG